MLDIAVYEMKKLRLEPGDKIVLFSDGVSEAESAAGEFFDGKLKETLRAHAGSSCSELNAKLVEAVEDFSEGAKFSDDITTLVLEYNPGAA
jgi:serine phosphatase RsbU (regulator of sigma subunit)